MDKTVLKERIRHALAREVGPALDMDGTLIEVMDVEDGIAVLRLTGVCGNCPSSIMAAVMGIEEELKKQIPEIRGIEAAP